MDGITLWAVPTIPVIEEGDDVAGIIVEQIRVHNMMLLPDDVIVIAQKIVSKAEGRLVRLRDVMPTQQAQALAMIVEKDPAKVQVILDDSESVIRASPGLLIVEQKSGWICANAGVDRSNVAPAQDSSGLHSDDVVALLPEDADASALQIRRRIEELCGVAPAVLIIDSHGRPWRMGTVGVCIGCAGMPPIWDQRGRLDMHGYELMSSEECIADELAGAASLLMGQSDEGRPVVVVRGYKAPADSLPAPATSIQRPKDRDAFR